MTSSGKSKLWIEKKKQELSEILNHLYPNPHSELNFASDYQLLISVILSAQCTDKKVNEVTMTLFRDYKNFHGLAKGTTTEVASIIRQVNYYKTKAKNIVATAKIISEQYAGKLPRTREQLESLPGVGRKTANVVLSEKNIEPAFPVDTHVYRLAKRLKLATRKDRDKVEEQLRMKFPPEQWRTLHHQLIFHGRRVCKAQRPLCNKCELSTLCPSVTT